MEFNITPAHFKIDTILPAIQTAAVYGTMEVLGRLGQYRVAAQTAVLIGSVASLVSSFVKNFDLHYIVDYAAIPVSVGLGVLAHRFFYPAIPTQAVLDARGAVIITAVLAAVKLAADAIRYYQVKEKVEVVAKEVKDDVKAAGEAVKEGAAAVVEKAAEKVEEKAAEVKDAAAAAQPKPATPAKAT